MSVFTSVNTQQLVDWLADYQIGEVADIKGISAGITNTNYFVTTNVIAGTAYDGTQASLGENRYVLTLFEHNEMAELPFYVDLMAHLANHNVPCPKPITNQFGESLKMLSGKPALMVSCLAGSDVKAPNLKQCAEIGRVLAQMHVASQRFDNTPYSHANQNQRGATWRLTASEQVMPHIGAENQALLKETIAFQESLDLSALPKGIIHADLFRDNVLFDGDKVGGFIDFYYACYDVLAYDIAIAVNDWCVEADGQFDLDRLNALLDGYQSVRVLTEPEQRNWNGLLRIAALRFWLSRLYDQAFPQAGEMTHAKDADEFKRIVLLRAENS